MSSMHSIRQAARRLARHWNRVPGWVGLLLCAASIAFAAWLTWHVQDSRSASSQGEYLLDGRKFTDSQLGPIVQSFAKSKLIDFVIDDHRIRVPRGRASMYLTSLAEGDALPPDFHTFTDKAMQQGTLLETGQDRQRRFRHAREKELAHAIRAMEGIENALVQFDEVEPRGFRSERIMTASVAIMPIEGHVIDRRRMVTIRRLVAATKAGMTPEDVRITDLRSGTSYGEGGNDDVVLNAADDFFRIKREVELDWTRKVTHVLSFVPTAQVAVEVGFAGEATDRPTKDGVLVELNRLAISVAVPESYLSEVWRSDRAAKGSLALGPPAPAQLQTLSDEMQIRIRDAIRGLIPEDMNVASGVTVTTFHDVKASHRSAWLPGLLLIRSMSRHRVAWVAVITVGIIVGLATRFRLAPPSASMRPGTNSSQTAAAGEVNRSIVQFNADEDLELNEGQLRDTLTDLIRDNPDGAAKILHRWIDKAG